LKYAQETKDSRIIYTTKLTLAQAYLNIGENNKSLETVLQAKDYFAAKGFVESAWLSCFIAAQASHQLGNPVKAKEFASESLSALNQLRNIWGEENFSVYLSKPNINFYFQQANELANS
jgi:hypothetical protein